MTKSSAKLVKPHGSPNIVAILPLSQDKIDRRLQDVQKNKVEPLTRILLDKNEYMNHPSFYKKKEVDIIFETVLDMSEFESLWNRVLASLDDIGKKEIEQELSRKKVFTKNEEVAAFLQYNYVRFRACRIIKAIHSRKVDNYKLDDLLYWHDRQLKLENTILLGNVGLTLGALGKITHRQYSEDSQYAGEALAAVLRAIRKFDISKGWKFSTYATNAIIRSIYREISKRRKKMEREIIGFDDAIGNVSHQSIGDNSGYDFDAAEKEDQRLSLRECLKNNSAQLTAQEDRIIRLRFGYDVHGESTIKPMTLDETGKFVQLTKERVRQIQNRALTKISSYLGGQYHATRGSNRVLYSGKKRNLKI